MSSENAKSLKKKLYEQLKPQSFVDIESCKKLIALAEQEHNDDVAAIGHIWLAEFFLQEENKLGCQYELEIAKNYLDENLPSETLEKFYFIKYKLYTALYDVQVAFDYCLKSLEVSELLYENPTLVGEEDRCFVNTAGNRVAGNYGNIGINFFNHDIYDKALLYCNKALIILKTLDTANAYAECLLRLNVIISLIRTGSGQDILQYIYLLEKIDIAKEDLKIYVDYAYASFYLYKANKEKAEFYISELINDQIEKYADRLTAIDFYLDLLLPTIELKMKEQAEILFEEIISKIREDDEVFPAMRLVKLKIMYSDIFGENEKVNTLYKEYFELYQKNEKKADDLRTNGLEIRLKLHEIELENSMAKNQNNMLEDIANYDELTKVFNRRHLTLKYNELLQTDILLCSLAIIDVDFFKEYNDNYGHLLGDSILKTVAKCLKNSLSEKMIVCRYGGDEFVVLSWESDFETLYLYTKEIESNLAEMKLEHKMSRCSDRITISVGCGCKRIETHSDIRDLFLEVDRALYRAKERGRNQIVRADDIV